MHQLRAAVLLAFLAFAVHAQGSRVEALEFESEAVGRPVELAVHLPAGYDAKKKYPVIYFLHGAGRNNHRTWERRGANEILDGLVKDEKVPACIVACPNGGFGFYVNWKDGEKSRNADMIVKDLVAFIEKKYGTLREKKYRALLGDSMGGYGALVNGLHNPDKFGILAAHEAYVFTENPDDLPRWVRQGRRGVSIVNRIFGDPIDQTHWKHHNLFHLVNTGDPKKLADVSVYFDVGESDRYGLAKPNSQLSALMKKKKIPHEFELRDGGHGREFFIDNLPHSLAFIGKAFKRASKQAASK